MEFIFYQWGQKSNFWIASVLVLFWVTSIGCDNQSIDKDLNATEFPGNIVDFTAQKDIDAANHTSSTEIESSTSEITTILNNSVPDASDANSIPTEQIIDAIDASLLPNQDSSVPPVSINDASKPIEDAKISNSPCVLRAWLPPQDVSSTLAIRDGEGFIGTTSNTLNITMNQSANIYDKNGNLVESIYPDGVFPCNGTTCTNLGIAVAARDIIAAVDTLSISPIGVEGRNVLIDDNGSFSSTDFFDILPFFLSMDKASSRGSFLAIAPNDTVVIGMQSLPTVSVLLIDQQSVPVPILMGLARLNTSGLVLNSKTLVMLI